MATLTNYIENNFEPVFNNTVFAGATLYFRKNGLPLDLTGEKILITFRTRAKSTEITDELSTEGDTPELTITDAAGGVVDINADQWTVSFPEAGVYVWDAKLMVSGKIYTGGTFTVKQPVTQKTSI